MLNGQTKAGERAPRPGRAGCAVLLCSAFAFPAIANAQAATGDQVEEIIVTAQRRGEALQKVPIAVTALQGDVAKAVGIDTSEAIAMAVPGLSLNQTSSSLTPFLRGVGQNLANLGIEAPVGIYIDNVYQPAPLANMFDLNNIDRVEVLKGPQGTLFGRNSSAGVINIITRAPSETPSGELRLGYGRFGALESSLYATGRVANNLAADLAVVFQNQEDGWGRAPRVNEDLYRGWSGSIRTKWQWTPSENTMATLAVDYRKGRDTGTVATIVPGALGVGGAKNIGFYNSDVDAKPFSEKDKSGASLLIEQNLGWAKIVSISAYQNFHVITAVDSDATAQPIRYSIIKGRDEAVTQELHLVSPDESALRWIVGAFYMQDKVRLRAQEVGTSVPAAFGNTIVTSSDLVTKSYSAFAQSTVDLLPTTRITAGVRYTSDERDLEGYRQGSIGPRLPSFSTRKWDKVTYRLALDHDLSDRTMAYLSFNTGFKSGALNPNAPQTAAVEPESVDAFELGLKNELFDRRLRLNLALFHYDYRNMQIRQIQNGVLVLGNAASSKIKGVDLDFEAKPMRGLTLGGGLEYLDAKYQHFPTSLVTTPRPTGGNVSTVGDVSGNKLIQSPKFSTVVNARYEVIAASGTVTVAANYKRNTRLFWDPDNRLSMGPTDIVNTSVSWTDPGNRWLVSVWIDNLLDEKYYSNATGTSLGGDVYAAAAPRTYGVTFGLNW